MMKERTTTATAYADRVLHEVQEFASGRPDSRADVGTDWLRALTTEQLTIVSGWIEAAGEAADRPDRAS